MRSLLLPVLALGALAAPAPAVTPVVLETRTVVEDRIQASANAPEPTVFAAAPLEKRTNVLASELSIFASLVSVGVAAGLQKVAFTAIASELAALKPTATPTATQQVPSMLSSIHVQASPTGYLEAAVARVLNGLTNKDTLNAIVTGGSIQGNSAANTANPAPSKSVYPYKLPCDAPYSQSESILRQQIYIPSTFTYGKKPPVILFPGTGGRGGLNFAGNFEVTLANVDYADIIWVNSASFLLTDAQLNSELAAYAINYVSAISGGVNVSIIAWSQGNLNVQWATKYWPSTQLILSDHIAISPDYHGTTLASLIDPGNSIGYAPAVLQQQYNSKYVSTLRSNGGDSAYVPTTNIWSAVFDEIVEPQQNPNASAYLNDARGVGVTNAQVQDVCGADSPAGFFQTHESMLANSLSYYLAIDALQNPGPGLVSRIPNLLTSVCQQPFAPGLSLANVLETENDIVVALVAILLYPSPTLSEPAISAYATKSPTTCAASTTSKSSTVKAAVTSSVKTSATVTAKTSRTSTSRTRSSSVKTTSTKH